jgi:hypothetical protein
MKLRQFPPAPGGIAGLVGYPTFLFGYNKFWKNICDSFIFKATILQIY